MTFEKEKVKHIEFGGTVFMYGNIQIIAILEDKKTILIERKGSDGFTDKENKKTMPVSVFNSLIDTISKIDYEVKHVEEKNTYEIVDDVEYNGKDWYLGLLDEENNIIQLIQGCNPEGKEFKETQERLSDICKEFQTVGDFLK